MKDRGGRELASWGYTIVEVLIVLAVSGAMLVVATTFISQKQQKTQFMVASRNLRQKFESIINETQSGYMSGGTDFRCVSANNHASSSAQPQLRIHTDLSPPNQTNCVLLGNVLVFGRVQDATDSEINYVQKFASVPLIGSKAAIDSGVGMNIDAKDIETTGAKTVRVFSLDGLEYFGMRHTSSGATTISDANTLTALALVNAGQNSDKALNVRLYMVNNIGGDRSDVTKNLDESDLVSLSGPISYCFTDGVDSVALSFPTGGTQVGSEVFTNNARCGW